VTHLSGPEKSLSSPAFIDPDGTLPPPVLVVAQIWKLSHHHFLLAWIGLYPIHILPVLYLLPLPSPNHFTLKIEAEWSSGTLVSYNTTHCHNPEGHNLNHCHSNLKF